MIFLSRISTIFDARKRYSAAQNELITTPFSSKKWSPKSGAKTGVFLAQKLMIFQSQISQFLMPEKRYYAAQNELITTPFSSQKWSPKSGAKTSVF